MFWVIILTVDLHVTSFDSNNNWVWWWGCPRNSIRISSEDHMGMLHHWTEQNLNLPFPYLMTPSTQGFSKSKHTKICYILKTVSIFSACVKNWFLPSIQMRHSKNQNCIGIKVWPSTMVSNCIIPLIIILIRHNTNTLLKSTGYFLFHL